MFCPNCGTQNADTAAFCANCGSPLKSTSMPGGGGSQPNPNPTPPPGNYNPNPNPGYNPNPNPNPQGADLIIKILSFCFPIVGLVLYFVWQKERPQAAKDVCTWAAIGFGVGVVFYIIMALAGGGY